MTLATPEYLWADAMVFEVVDASVNGASQVMYPEHCTSIVRSG